MLSGFLVLGQIPDTSIQITFYELLDLFTIVLACVLFYVVVLRKNRLWHAASRFRRYAF